MPSDTQSPAQLTLDRILSNPLLEGLPPQWSLQALAISMRHRPLMPAEIRTIPVQQRLLLLGEFRKIFVPTRTGLQIASSIDRLLREGLAARDPRDDACRRFIYKASELRGSALRVTEWWPSFAAGLIVEGITGLGKSQNVDRYLQLLPQVIEHGHRSDCGWRSMKQLVYLKVHMPSDGSRGGFLASAMLELDKALGTAYACDYSGRNWTVEKLLVEFLHLLSVHRCGLLIIEEAQEKNLSSTAFSAEFVTFFLRVLNWGTPVVLIGNPLAFRELRRFCQDADRFSEGGWYTMIPLQDHSSDEWRSDWMVHLWQPTLLDLPDEAYARLSQDPLDATLEGAIWRRTAGIPRYVCRLRQEVQEVALQTGASAITPTLVEQVFTCSPKFTALRPRIKALVRKDWTALQEFSDMPVDQFRALWRANGTTDLSARQPGLIPAPSSAPKRKGSTSKKKSKSTPRQPADQSAERQLQDALMQGIAAASGEADQ